MPWTHCGALVKDDVACPTCGSRKGSWTVRQNVTRTFMLGTGVAPAEEQVEALEDAADAGAAFCEDCQAADDAPEAGAEEAPEEAPASDPDEEAQIETLEAAAASGSPFCEECQRRDGGSA